MDQIDAVISALAENAASLIKDAKVLLATKGFARAHALAHLAREELSRISILHAVAVRILSGVPVDWKKTQKRLRDHKVKIYQETLVMGIELSANGDKVGANKIFSNIPSVVEYRNNRKNAALYVNIEDGQPVIPNSAFSLEQACRCIQLAEYALEQNRIIFEKLGPFATRSPIEIEDPEPFLRDNPDKHRELLHDLAEFYKLIIKMDSSGDPQSSSSSSETPHPPVSAPELPPSE